MDKDAMVGLHKNLQLILAKELADAGWDADCRRIGMITQCLHVLRGHAARATKEAAWACKEEVRQALKSQVPEHKIVAEEIKKAWMAQPWAAGKATKAKSE